MMHKARPSRREFLATTAAGATGVFSTMRHRTLPPDVGQRLTQAAAEHRKGHMYLDDQPLRTVAEIRTLAERLNERLLPCHH